MTWQNDFNNLSPFGEYIVYINNTENNPHLDYSYNGQYKFCDYDKDKDIFVERSNGKGIEKEKVSAFQRIYEPPKGFRAQHDDAKVCEECGGKGTVKKTYIDEQAGIRDEWTGDCDYCRGKGYTEED